MIIQFDVGKETFKETFKEAFKETFKKAFKETLKKAFQEAIQDGFQEALKEAFQGKEALKETLQEALQETFKEALKEAFREALRVQELRSFVPLYGRDESFCHGGDGDRALCSQVGFFLSVPYHIKMIKASLVVPKQTIFLALLEPLVFSPAIESMQSSGSAEFQISNALRIVTHKSCYTYTANDP